MSLKVLDLDFRVLKVFICLLFFFSCDFVGSENFDQKDT